MKLVIVETPAQAKALTGSLGDGWRVEPCYSSVRDLVGGELGIDTAADFRPTFAIAAGKGNLVRRLMKALRGCEAIYAATPPGRTGELIAWHILALSPDMGDKPVYRVTLVALTPDAVQAAFAAPRPLNMNWIEAELALRTVDRLAGYTVNAAARQADLDIGLSRTAMIALCRLADRENEIAAHTPLKRWTVSARLELDGVAVAASLYQAQGKSLVFSSREQADKAAFSLKAAQYWLVKTGLRELERPAPAIQTLPELLAAAEHKLGIAPSQTLALLGTLYDAGWITHPLSAVPAALIDVARTYIRREFGTDYVTAEAAIPAHCIAPADIERLPEDLPGDGAALYGLIWRQFMAALLPPARLRQSGARIAVGLKRERPFPLELRATGTLVAFDGWLRVQPDDQGDSGGFFAGLREGASVTCTDVSVEAQTAPTPEHFTAGTLIAEHGAADPVGWSRALAELEQRDYIERADGRLLLTSDGTARAQWLSERYPSVVSAAVVNDLERDIEQIAVGERGRVEIVREFWERLTGELRPVESPAEPTRAAGEHKPVILRPVAEAD